MHDVTYMNLGGILEVGPFKRLKYIISVSACRQSLASTGFFVIREGVAMTSRFESAPGMGGTLSAGGRGTNRLRRWISTCPSSCRSRPSHPVRFFRGDMRIPLLFNHPSYEANRRQFTDFFL